MASATVVERRRHHRYNLLLPVRVRARAATDPHLETTSRDISASGIFFAIAEGFELGSELELEFSLPPELSRSKDFYVRCRGRIVRVERPEQEGKIGLAITIENYEVIEPEPDTPPETNSSTTT